MPRPRKAIPSVVHHKPTGQARVRIGGRDFYLGRFGSQEAREAYVRLLGEIQTAGRETVRMVRDLSDDSAGPTVAELCLAFLDHAEATYRKNGRATSTCSTFKTPIRALRTLYGDTPAKNFGPIALEAVRQLFVDEGVSRGVANSYAGNVRRIFRWGVSRQLVPVSVIQSLECLAPLRAGRTTAPERPPVAPVADATIDATLPYLPTVVQAMIRLQRWTGMRPGEVCSIRPADIDRSHSIWVYRPAEHKTQHRDRTRVIYIGPRAQEVLLPYLSRPATAHCFSPAEAAQEVRDRRHAQRKTPAGRGNEIGANRKRKPVRTPGERYDVASYRRAIWRACERAFDMPKELRVIPPDADNASERREVASQWRDAHCWNPNQIRHTAATAIRREAGLEAVQAALGHARMDTSEIYAEKSETLARDVAQRLG